jgi:hypothetical protein
MSDKYDGPWTYDERMAMLRSVSMKHSEINRLWVPSDVSNNDITGTNVTGLTLTTEYHSADLQGVVCVADVRSRPVAEIQGRSESRLQEERACIKPQRPM